MRLLPERDSHLGQGVARPLSGILISAKALLDRNPAPSRAEIAAALDHNLCRCGAHNRIIRAIRRAASARSGASP